MSDKPSVSRANPVERFFNLLGWLGFLLLVPIGLDVFGIGGPLAWIKQNLGVVGQPSFLVLIFFGLLLLRILFGADRIISPLLIGYGMGFLLLAVVVDFGFMAWYKSLVANVPFLLNAPLTFLTAIGVVLLGILLSYVRRLSIILQVLILVVVPLVFLGFTYNRPAFLFGRAPGSSLSIEKK